MARIRVASWNVNGIRACVRKGLIPWLRSSRPHIVALQEVRALPDEIPEELGRLRGWHLLVSAAERRGYSGVGLLARREPDEVETSLGVRRFDVEGRLQLARFGRLIVANAYFPKGSGSARDNSRVPYKLAFTAAVRRRLGRLRRAGFRVLALGDFNTAHREIDLARPRDNAGTSGFLPRERAELDRWAAEGWVDTFRHFEPGPNHYTWWSQRFGVRERNIGWRIDYVLASRAAMRYVERAFIQPQVRGSDHCPLGVDVDPRIFG
jgi:exodeoxyribonuclease-3